MKESPFKSLRASDTRRLGGGKRCNRSDRREKRHIEALERQKRYNALTIEQKIERCTPGSDQMKKLLMIQEVESTTT